MTQTPQAIAKDAFDYVTGVMRGAERRAFAAQLQHNRELQLQVQFWEEELIAMSDIHDQREPDPSVWPRIEQRLQRAPTRLHWWQHWQLWLTTSMAAVIIALSLALLLPKPIAPASDYVAVLTNPQGQPLLTALTGTQSKTLQLTWAPMAIPRDKNLQLWALSRRDGQIRSLAVFAHADQTHLALTDTHLHLIRDAAFLWLTEEEVGGSPLDEPSSKVIAKGACVFLDSTRKTL